MAPSAVTGDFESKDSQGGGSGGDVEATCEICSAKYVVSVADKRYRLPGHCFKCSGKARSVSRKETNESVKQWFSNLRHTDPEQYAKILQDADSARSSSSGYINKKFTLVSYKESHEEMKGNRLNSDFELMTWPWYKEAWRAGCLGD